MAWGTAASFVGLYTRRERPVKSSKRWKVSLRAAPIWGRTQPMVPLASTSVSKQRSERRISVRLPLKVRGRDAHGFAFEEDTSSENLCRNGAAFVTRFDVAIGSDLEIRIPFSHHASRRPGSSAPSRSADADFATQGRVVHVGNSQPDGERMVGVQFTGPRFQRVFRSESAA